MQLIYFCFDIHFSKEWVCISNSLKVTLVRIIQTESSFLFKKCTVIDLNISHSKTELLSSLHAVTNGYTLFGTVHKVLEHGLGYCESCRTLFDSLEEKILHDDFLHAQLK